MTEEKMMRLLECWTDERDCHDCPLKENGCFNCCVIPDEIPKSLLHLIRRKNFTIERLEEEAFEQYGKKRKKRNDLFEGEEETYE